MILFSQTNQVLVIDIGVHPSLHTNCHHQITFSRYNLTVEYPPPYERPVWDSNKANTESIKQALMQVNRPNLFFNKDVHQQVRMLNNIVINVFLNFVLNKIVTFDDRDLPWTSEYIKRKLSNVIIFTKTA